MNVSRERPSPRQTFELCLLAGTVAVSAAAWLVLLSRRGLWFDELLSLWTDRVPSAFRIVWIQANAPISLDPPAYHLLAHAAMIIFGANGFALRVPAFLGMLMMEISIAELLRRTADLRAAVLATAVPFAALTSRFAAEGRPYGLLYGLYAASLLLWYLGRAASSPRRRTFAATGLALVLVTAIYSSFFGLLILLPVTAGELVQTIADRKLQWKTLAAILGGYVSLAGLLPFSRGIAPFRANYYQLSVPPQLVPRTFAFFFSGSPNPTDLRHLQVVVSLAVVLAVLVSGGLAIVRLRDRLPAGLAAAIMVLFATPVSGYLLGRFVTHTAFERQIQFGGIAITLLLGYALTGRLTRAGLVACVFFLLATGIVFDLQWDRANVKTAQFFRTQSLPSPAERNAMEEQPSDPIYTGSLGFYMEMERHLDPATFRRLKLVYRDTSGDFRDLTIRNLGRFAGVPVVPYSAFAAAPPRLVLDERGWTPYTWLGDRLETDGYAHSVAGQGMLGQLWVVTAIPPRTAAVPAPASKQTKDCCPPEAK